MLEKRVSRPPAYACKPYKAFPFCTGSACFKGCNTVYYKAPRYGRFNP